METMIYCICGLPATGGSTDLGSFCGKECFHVAVYMDRVRAKERQWMQAQYRRVPGLWDTLETLKWEHKMAVEQHSY